MNDQSAPVRRTEDSGVERRSAVGDWLYEASTQLPAAGIGVVVGAVGDAVLDRLRGPRSSDDSAQGDAE